MSEWSIEHAWKLIPFTRADAHQIPPTHFRSTTSRNNDVLQRVHVSRGVCPGFRGVCDTFLTQSRFLFKLKRRHTDAHGLVHSIWQYRTLDRLIARRRRSSAAWRREAQSRMRQKNEAFKSFEELREPGASAYVPPRASCDAEGLCGARLDAVRSLRRRDASAPSCGRHPVDAREHARHVALVAESGGVRCLCK
jgi:hypothetical protein